MGASSTPFWFGALLLAAMPTSVGYQDFAALVRQHVGLSQRLRDHLIASPFGTIEHATFTYGRPIGTSVPAPLGYRTVNFHPDAADANTDWRIDAPLNVQVAAPVEYPSVNRRLKGDRQQMYTVPPAAAAPEPLPQLERIDVPASASRAATDSARAAAAAHAASEKRRRRRCGTAAGAAGAFAARGAGAAARCSGRCRAERRAGLRRRGRTQRR